MTQKATIDNQTNLDICEADKKDLEDEVKHLKEMIKAKNHEIGVLRSKLRNSEAQMIDLQNFLMSQVSALTAKLTHPVIPADPQPVPKHDEMINDQDTNQDPPPALLSLPTSSTQPSQDINAKIDVTPTPEHPVPSSSSQPVEQCAKSICTTASFSDEEQESPPVKKLKFECENCVEAFSTTRALSYHMYHNHGDLNSSDDEDPFANIQKIKNIQLRNSKTVRQGQAACTKCKKVVLKSNLMRHVKGCKKKVQAVSKRVDREEGDILHVLTEENPEEVFKNPLFMEMISFTVRSTSASEEGVTLHKKIQIPVYFSVSEVVARFSKKLFVPMDRLVMRCNGRELSAEEEVRGLANQTVWLSVIGVKEEKM